MRNGDQKVTSEKLTRFRDFFVYDDDLANRMSQLMWLDLYMINENMGVSPPEILESIKDVESGEAGGRGVKLATQFNKDPLRGFWHKHYFSAHSLVHNMILGLGKDGVAKIVREVMDTGEPTVTKAMIEALAHRVTTEPVERRDAQKKLTGEWIIFAKHEGKNYYLCANTHGAGDDFIYNRISEHCIKDFPDVLSWR